MSRKSVFAAAAAAVALACASPAAAAVVVYTYKGTVSETYAFSIGELRPGPADLVGRAFTATFWRDDATPGAVISDGGDFTSIGSSPDLEAPPSPIRASLTIEGESPLFLNTAGSQLQYRGPPYEGFIHNVSDESIQTLDSGDRAILDRNLAFNVSGPTDYLLGPDYHSLPSLTAAATPGLFWYGYLEQVNAVYDPQTNDLLSYQGLNIIFTPTSLTVSTPTPEPGAWALMLVGFFGAGAVLRWRRRAAA
jgi:hypothetical protein